MKSKKGLISLLVYVFLVTIAITIIALDTNPNLDVQKIKSSLIWDKNNTISDKANTNDTLIYLVYGGVDYLGDAIFRISKDGIDYANVHREIDGWTLIRVIMLCLLIPIIWPLFMIIASLILLFKEWRANRKDKKEIERLKGRLIKWEK